MNNIAIGGAYYPPPRDCEYCQKKLEDCRYAEINFDNVNFNGTSYCMSCLITNIKKVKELEDRIDDLEKTVKELSDMLYYSPIGPGYEEAKKHFESLKN